MSNELALLNEIGGQLSTSIGAAETFEDLAKGPDFLGRLQLFGKGKYIDKGLVRPGHYGIPISAEEVIDLGPTVDVLPLCRRPKAIDMSDKPVISVFDETDPEFQRIRDQSGVKNSGCQFGPSFLVIERSTGRLLEFFLGAPTHRPEAQKIYPMLQVTQADIDRLEAAGKPIDNMTVHGPIPFTLKAKYIEREFAWYVPVVMPCSTPFTKLPRKELIQKEWKKFLEAKSEIEAAEEAPAKGKTSRKR